MSAIDKRLKELNIILPEVMPPVLAGYTPVFAPFIQTGNQVHISGRLGKKGGNIWSGKVGNDLSLKEAKCVAREVAIEILSVLKEATGELDRVTQIVKMFTMVNCVSTFTDPHRVADGASELFVEVFGERGMHARSAVGVEQTPFGACIEIDLIAEVDAIEV